MSALLAHLFLPHESNNQRARLLHPTSLILVISLFTLFQLVLSQLAGRAPQILGYASQIPPSEIVRLTNQERRAQGLNPVQIDAQLSSAAQQKAQDMFAHDYWAHVSPQGTQPWYFVTKNGYNYRFAGENLARDFSDPSSVVKAWMDSPSHRENLLNSRYQDIGVAVLDGKLDGRDTTLVVQFFGTRLTAAPAITSGKSSALAPAQAQAQVPVEAPVQPATAVTYAPAITTPFALTKYISLFLLGIFSTILVIDIYAIHKKRLARWTSRSFAHLVFMLFLLFAVAFINIGQIK